MLNYRCYFSMSRVPEYIFVIIMIHWFLIFLLYDFAIIKEIKAYYEFQKTVFFLPKLSIFASGLDNVKEILFIIFLLYL